MTNRSVPFFPDIKAASERLLVMRGEGADQFSDEVVALLRLEAEHEVGARPVIGDFFSSCYAAELTRDNESQSRGIKCRHPVPLIECSLRCYLSSR